MKKSVCLAVFFAFILLLTATKITTAITVTGSSITGETVTGEATQPVSMNISVTSISVPSLTIISPENETYLTNKSLLLNYSVSDEDAVLYNLDNTPNTTITSFVYFNTSQGSHTLYLYANNTNGVTVRNVSFFINSTRFIILYGEYNSSAKGSSTQFNRYQYHYEEIQNLSNFTLENAEYGKILFNEAVNLTNDADITDNTLDLDSNTNISSNRIELDPTALPNLDKQATLWLYNLTLSTPQILKDGSVCPSTICTQESYTGTTLKTLKFNVTGFSVYSARETPSAEEETPGPSGGGGGGTVSEELEFEVEPKLIKVMIKKGEIFKSSLKVKNTASSTQEFNIEAEVLKDFIIIPEKEFSLKAGEEKEIILIFSSSDDTKEGTYTGKIKIYTAKEAEEIPVTLGIKSKLLLFDATLSIPPKYKDVMPGDDIMFQISIFNLGEIGKVDVKINYYIKDFYGNTVAEQQGVVAVETQVSFSRSIKLPPDIADGQYIIAADVRYDASVGTTSDMFYVNRVKASLVNNVLLIAIILSILVTILGVILIMFHLNKKIKKMSYIRKNELNKIEDRIKKGNLKLAETAKMREKLKLQLSSLNKAYMKGYISRQSYESGKSKIKKAYNSLKKKYL